MERAKDTLIISISPLGVYSKCLKKRLQRVLEFLEIWDLDLFFFFLISANMGAPGCLPRPQALSKHPLEIKVLRLYLCVSGELRN